MNPCRKGHCWDDATPNTCDANQSTGSWTNVDGHPACVSITDSCKVGECFSQACTYVDNDSDTGFDDRCDDGDACTTDPCVKNGDGSFNSCGTHGNSPDGTVCKNTTGTVCEVDRCLNGVCVDVAGPDGLNCSDATGGTCHPKTCQSGVCQAAGNDITCPQPGDPNLHTCKKWQCAWSGSSASCSQVNNPGITCDVDANDCKVQTCDSGGRCKGVGLEAGVAKCDIDLTDCATGVCNSRRECTGFTGDSTLNGQSCNDGNVCTTASSCTDGSCIGTACASTSTDCPLCNVGNCSGPGGTPNCGCP